VDINYVITLSAADRPGIVEALSNAVAEAGGNWHESRMLRLAGRFAGVARVGIAEAHAGALEGALAKLESSGLELRVDRVQETSDVGDRYPLRLSLVGHDRPGIVHEISAALASREINVLELHTDCSSAPMSGERLFHARAELLCPSGLSAEGLRDALEEVGQDWMVDISLDEAAE
jgi:glycine cleavage system regulatory protein